MPEGNGWRGRRHGVEPELGPHGQEHRVGAAHLGQRNGLLAVRRDLSRGTHASGVLGAARARRLRPGGDGHSCPDPDRAVRDAQVRAGARICLVSAAAPEFPARHRSEFATVQNLAWRASTFGSEGPDRPDTQGLGLEVAGWDPIVESLAINDGRANAAAAVLRR